MPLSAPYDPVFDAIKSHIDGAWDSNLALLRYENDSPSAPAGKSAPWVQVVLDTALYGQQSIGGGQDAGDNRWDEQGTLWFHVFTPKNTGPREARRIAKALANLFRGARLLDDDLTFGDADMGAGDPGETNGNYYLLSVSLQYELIDAQ